MPEVLKRVGRFDLLEVVGRGGAAVVYLAMQRDLQRHVALKELAPFHLADSSFAERFVEESRLAGAMNHANIVTVHEYFEDGQVPYIAMEYLPHGSLRQYIGRLSLAQIAGVLEGVLAGLAHGEAHRIVHRDLKPENLLVAVDGRVKIADFGVARAYSHAATRAVVTVAGTTIGTPAYMSPEQALGSDLTPATDLYSLGIVAWELFTGRVPFEETDTPVAVLYRHVHEPIPSVRTVAPEVDAGIAAWLDRMLAKRPEERFQSADEAWLSLEDVVLELLGPRWRREARLAVDDAAYPSGRPLTPAPFDTADTPAAEEVPRTVTGAAVSPSGSEDDPAAPVLDGARAQATQAPARRPRRNTTMMRIARRHRDDGEVATAPAPDDLRRRLVALGILGAMVAAAIAGVLLAQPAAVPARHGLSPAQRRALTQLQAERTQVSLTLAGNRALNRIATKLAVTRVRALDRMLNAATPAQQVADVSDVQKAYRTAARQAASLSAKTPAAGSMATTMTAIAADYGRAVAAGRSGSRKAWNAAFNAAVADQKTLNAQLAKL